MTIFYYLIATIIAVTVFCLGFFAKRKFPDRFFAIQKYLSVMLLIVFFFRYMWKDDYILSVTGLALNSDFSSKALIIVAGIGMWLSYAAVILLIMYPFFKIKLLDKMVSTLVVFGFLFNFAFLFNQTIALDGADSVAEPTLKAILFSVEIGIGLGYALSVFIGKARELNLKVDIKPFLFGVLGVVLCSVPHYIPQLLASQNSVGLVAIDLNLWHRLYIYPIIIFPIVIYLIFRNKSSDVKLFALLFFALQGLINYSIFKRFTNFASVVSWPLHLCNTALYVTPLCLIFRWKKLFYFTYFINVLGAFLAIMMPNYSSGGVVLASTVGFFFDHYQAFFMPLLVVGLGIFERPRWREFRYSIVGFACYFVLVLVINAWFTNYDSGVDYFFINSGFVAEKLGTWAENLRNIVWTFDIGGLKFVFYPLYQALFFLVYFAASFGMWFLYELGYDTVSSWQDIALRNKKFKLDKLALLSKLDGRSLEEPMNKDGVRSLKLTNFSKRYGKSDVYAVKDASFEVFGGEIFGFLGPNGAGKSTIIKSIVGIQPITSGSIEIMGYDVAKQGTQSKRQVGFVPDHYALYEKLTAREYVNYIADLYDIPLADRNHRMDKFVEIFEFESAIDNQIKTYSHGMKQKVAIMAALIHNPPLWILDEPLTGLDPNSIFQVKECMKEHAKAGNIVFFSSHIIDVVERICDRIAIIKRGQIQCVKDLRELEKEGVLLEKFYMGIADKKIDAVKVGEAGLNEA